MHASCVLRSKQCTKPERWVPCDVKKQQQRTRSALFFLIILHVINTFMSLAHVIKSLTIIKAMSEMNLLLLCRGLSNFSFVFHLWKHSESFVLLKTSSKSDLGSKDNRQFYVAENNMIQKKFHTKIGCISKSIFKLFITTANVWFARLSREY